MKARSFYMWGFVAVCATIVFSSTLKTSATKNEQHSRQTDLIIFSYDRPLQLYGLLESIATYVRAVDTIRIVCRCSNKQYEQAYAQVWQKFPKVVVYRQSVVPEDDFKSLTMQALAACPHDYIMFAVDDMIVTEYIDCAQCIDLLERHAAYGFFLRMGRNLNYCYSMARAQPLPQFIVDDGRICLWQFAQGIYDWNYPHTVDMTLYRKHMVRQYLDSFEFRHPTSLEGTWASFGPRISNQVGICFAHSKVVNLPLNLVQQVAANNHMGFMSCAQLLDLFNQHKKIDISLLYRIDNKSAHMDYVPTFIERT